MSDTPETFDRNDAPSEIQKTVGNDIPRGDDAAIQSPTTTGGDRSDERRTVPEEGPVSDRERQEVDGGAKLGEAP